MSEQPQAMSGAEQARAEEVLQSEPIAYLALSDEGPYVIPVCFVYEKGDDDIDRGRVLIHTGEGRKSRALALDDRVCLAVAADPALYLGREPCRDGFTFRSVLVEGRATLLQGREEREAALRAIVAKYDPEAADRPFAEKDLQATLVYAVLIDSISYRQQLPRN